MASSGDSYPDGLENFDPTGPLGKDLFSDAIQHMQSQYGHNVEIWNLHGVTLQVSLVPVHHEELP